MQSADQWRKALIEVLDGTAVHAGVEAIVEGIPAEYRAKKVRGLPYTLWQLLEHIRLTQRDILNYMTDPDYEMPDEYWPAAKKPTEEMWEESVRALLRDLRKVKRMARDPKLDLRKGVPCGVEQHTLLREVVVLAAHNSYHLGEMVVLRRLLGIW